MPLLGAGGMFGFYLYLAKSTDVRDPRYLFFVSTHGQARVYVWGEGGLVVGLCGVRACVACVRVGYGHAYTTT